MGLYRNDQGGFACLEDQQGGTAFLTSTLERSPEQDLSRRTVLTINTQANATI